MGTDIDAVKQACISTGIAVEFKFMSEADPSTRKTHRTLGQYHGLEPQAQLSDLVKTPPIADMDLYMAGPPCPSCYALVGQGASGDDVRGTVLHHVDHCANCNTPNTFAIENVVGLPRKHPTDLAAVLITLRTAGYQVTWRILNPSIMLARKAVPAFILLACATIVATTSLRGPRISRCYLRCTCV